MTPANIPPLSKRARMPTVSAAWVISNVVRNAVHPESYFTPFLPGDQFQLQRQCDRFPADHGNLGSQQTAHVELHSPNASPNVHAGMQS